MQEKELLNIILQFLQRLQVVKNELVNPNYYKQKNTFFATCYICVLEYSKNCG